MRYINPAGRLGWLPSYLLARLVASTKALHAAGPNVAYKRIHHVVLAPENETCFCLGLSGACGEPKLFLPNKGDFCLRPKEV